VSASAGHTPRPTPGRRTLLRPRWLLLHVLTVAACCAMIWLGRWQWHAAARHHGELRNYAYAFQWWAFTAFALVMWSRIVHDHLHPDGARWAPPPEPPAAYVGYTPPPPPPADDPETVRFNDYLRRLHAADREASQ
jgi:hypothetical protein